MRGRAGWRGGCLERALKPLTAVCRYEQQEAPVERRGPLCGYRGISVISDGALGSVVHPLEPVALALGGTDLVRLVEAAHVHVVLTTGSGGKCVPLRVVEGRSADA